MRRFDIAIRTKYKSTLQPMSLIERATMKINNEKCTYDPIITPKDCNQWLDDAIMLPDELYHIIFTYVDDKISLFNIARSCTLFCNIVYEALSGKTVSFSIDRYIIPNNPTDILHIINHITGITKCLCKRCQNYDKFLSTAEQCINCGKIKPREKFDKVEFVTHTKYVCPDIYTGRFAVGGCKQSCHLISMFYKCYKCGTGKFSPIYINDIIKVSPGKYCKYEHDYNSSSHMLANYDDIQTYGCPECELNVDGYMLDITYGEIPNSFMSKLRESLYGVLMRQKNYTVVDN